MGADLAAAVARMHRGSKDPRYYAFPLQPHGQAQDDAALIVDAYLAEHPADDGEPADGAWLAASGFKHDAATGAYIAGPLAIRLTRIEVGSVRCATMTTVGTTLIPTPKDRGAVRRLLTALGVTLKE